MLRIAIKPPKFASIEHIVSAIADKMTGLMLQLQQHIVRDKLSGQVLNVRTGKLAESVQPDPTRVEGTKVLGSVRAGGDQAFYGRFHELGGSKSYPIVPVEKQALSFIWQGKHYIRQRVYRSPLPARPFMEPALEEMRGQIVAGIEEAVAGALATEE